MGNSLLECGGAVSRPMGKKSLRGQEKHRPPPASGQAEGPGVGGGGLSGVGACRP